MLLDRHYIVPFVLLAGVALTTGCGPTESGSSTPTPTVASDEQQVTIAVTGMT